MRLWSSRCRGRRASVEYRRAGPGGPAVHGLPAHDHASRGFTPAELSGDGSGYGSSPMCLEGLRRAARPRRAWILTEDDAVVQLLREKVQAPEGCACCLEGAAHSVRLEAVLGVLLWVWGGGNVDCAALRSTVAGRRRQRSRGCSSGSLLSRSAIRMPAMCRGKADTHAQRAACRGSVFAHAACGTGVARARRVAACEGCSCRPMSGRCVTRRRE
ncbi:hypothetical protein CUR178_08162 [Leishmania enriettii]|uniref:Uncharacterized protein n=1 Tax=Leishmania enriettii TaxID=5663 RepID=A0A836I2I4_LEIEN|nr:hypothetical protein CUR178_08162 [Leishmania enriettii]